jgi:hypothetical protein
VLHDHSPPSSPRSQTSSHPFSPSPLVGLGIPSPVGSNLPTSSSPTLSHSESEGDEHLDIPSTPITRHYHATVEDVTDDEDDSELEYNTMASQRSPSLHHHSDIHPHFGKVPSNQGSSPSHDDSNLHTPEPKITQTYHSDLTGKFLSILSFYLIQQGNRSVLQ